MNQFKKKKNILLIWGCDHTEHVISSVMHLCNRFQAIRVFHFCSSAKNGRLQCYKIIGRDTWICI